METKTILIVDDEEEIRLSLERYLKKHGFNILTSHNGREGYKTYFNEKVDLVISDIRMPTMDGVEFLKLIKKDDSNFPFILITGFADILETKSAYELGANGFLPKPFRLNDLLKTVKDCLGEFDDPEQVCQNYQGIRIEEFITGSKIDFPIYIKLSDKKFIKIADCGEDINPSRIGKYKEKEVDKLYLSEQDHDRYMGLIKKITSTLKDQKINIASSKKLEFMKVANNIIMENIFSKDLDNENFEDAKNIVGSTLSIIPEMDSMLKLIKSISETSDELFSHAVSVSMLSVMLTKKLGWILEKNRTNIAMAGMFHDIGKRNMPKDLVKKKLIDLTFDEKQELNKHTIYGANMLMETPKIPSDIIDVALQHHENCLGTGFPNKTSKNRIHPLAKIVSITNEFMNLAEQYKEEGGEEKFYVALRRLIVLKYRTFEADYFKAFIELFSFGHDLMKEHGYE